MKQGQSLVEILVAIGVGTLLIIGALSILVPTLRSHSSVTNLQIASSLAKELLDNTRVMGEGDWHYIATLGTSTVNKYYIIASTSPYSTSSGIQSVLVATTTYWRYFYLDDVYRDDGGKIRSTGTHLDPSTKKITVWAAPDFSSTTASTTITSYLARTLDKVISQTDWTGGPNQDGPASGTNSRFSTSSNINYTASTGSIKIQGF